MHNRPLIAAILQARVSSTRLPGKVLRPILGVPMIIRQIERIHRAQLIDKLIIATSTDPTDNTLADLCEEKNIVFFRGSLNDVLDRFYQAAKPLHPEHIVRLTGDCPLTDPQLVDRIITFHLQGGFDYTSNALEPTYPDGLDVEIFRFPCLDQAWKEATLPSQREHVTPFINRQPDRYRIGHIKNAVDLSHLRWTVDEPLDFVLVTRIYEELLPENPEFTTDDVLALLNANPELITLNARYARNEGYRKSLADNALFLNKKD